MGNTILYDQIGSGYNSTRQADPYIFQQLLQLLSPPTNGLYMDIGCGTGNYTIAFAEKGFKFCGVEPSEEMMSIACRRNKNINWLTGSAEQIPVAEAAFDGAIATLTLHHWANLIVGFGEICRVLKQDANFIIFTALPAQMQGYWLNHYFPVMMADSIQQMPSLETIAAAAKETGLSMVGAEKYFIAEDLKDHFLYAGKHHPEIYLDENIRRGISSFAKLANLNEVQAGFIKLEHDITTGNFRVIKDSFKNNKGDYMFIALNKNSWMHK